MMALTSFICWFVLLYTNYTLCLYNNHNNVVRRRVLWRSVTW